MATRVLSVRFDEREYEALLGLSLIEDEPMGAIIRKATGKYIFDTVESPDYPQKKEAAIERAETASRKVAQAVGIAKVDDTGTIPKIRW